MKQPRETLSKGQRIILALLLPIGIIFSAYIFITVDYTYTIQYQSPIFVMEDGKLVPKGTEQKTSEHHPNWNSWEATWWIWALAFVGITGVELYLFKPED
jgi:hypothetical protein